MSGVHHLQGEPQADDVVVDYEADEDSDDQLIDEDEDEAKSISALSDNGDAVDSGVGSNEKGEESSRNVEKHTSLVDVSSRTTDGRQDDEDSANVSQEVKPRREKKDMPKMETSRKKNKRSSKGKSKHRDSSSTDTSSSEDEGLIRDDQRKGSQKQKRGYDTIKDDSASTNTKRQRVTTGGRSSESNTERKPFRESYGVYIPPFRRRQIEEEKKKQANKAQDTEEGQLVDVNGNPPAPSLQEQRKAWEDLKKSINGTINRLNSDTIKPLIHSLFQSANLIRGKGLLAKAILRATITSPTYAHVYAALLAVINTKLPEIGELVLTRSIMTFRRSFGRKEKGLTLAIVGFIGHLFNQGLCHELLCLQILTVLLEGDVTDDGVEVSIKFLSVIGMSLLESTPAGVHAVMEQLRSILQDGRSIGRRVLLKIEDIIKDRKLGFKMYPSILDELDLVEREEQIMFEIGLDDEGLKKEEELDYFHFDPDWNTSENTWLEIRKEILGEDSDSDGDEEDSDDDEESGSDEDSDEDDEDGVLETGDNNASKKYSSDANQKQITAIHDLSESDLVHLRRTIYLTIMSSATFEECTHKLARTDIPDGKEMELINMIIECCSQERTFLRYYGLISARFCLLHDRWRLAFENAFAEQYNTIHRLETNKLRNVAKLFAHLLHTDSLPWSCLSTIHLNEDETTSSSRIFLKILMQEMAEALGIATIVRRFECDGSNVKEWCKSLFPTDNPRNTRYAINFFTSIGLGPLTDGLRDYLKNAPKMILAQAEAEAAKKAAEESSDDSSSDSSTEESSLSSSSSSGSSSESSLSSSSSSSYSSSSSESSVSRRRKRRSDQKKRRSRRRSRSSSTDTNSSSESDSSHDSSSYSRRKKRSGRRRSRRSSRSSERSSKGSRGNRSREAESPRRSSSKSREKRRSGR